MKKHILILGSGGMLGHIVNLRLRELSDFFDVTDIARTSRFFKPTFEMDVTDFNALKLVYEKVMPDVVVNCIGILNTNAENNPADAILINSYLPHYLEKITSKSACKVIHISTDCVFSGDKGYYLENDFMDANGYYGRSKALGEIRNTKDLTIRTSIIGPELNTDGIGIFLWFSKQSGTIQGYTDVFWTGVTTVELSNAIVSCIKDDIIGIYHMVNGERISKYDLLHFFKNAFSKSLVTSIKKNSTYRYDKSLVNTRTDFAYRVPSYERMIDEMKLWIINHQNIYPHYQSIL